MYRAIGQCTNKIMRIRMHLLMNILIITDEHQHTLIDVRQHIPICTLMYINRQKR